jgi:uncharacterized membrane protein YfcA
MIELLTEHTGLTIAQFLGLCGFAAMAGLSRGFAGFGAALIFVPLASILIPPQSAVPILWLIDFTMVLPLTITGFRNCNWPEIRPMFVGAIFGVPLGTWLLATLPADPMKWIVAILVLIAVAGLASGYRRKKPMPLPGMIAVGGAAGIGSGAAALGGPPAIVFWASSMTTSAAQMRMNIFAFFGLTGITAGIMHFSFGLFTTERVVTAILLGPVYGLAIFTGSRMFGLVSEKGFRIFALCLCAAAAIMVMPIWH